MDDDALAPCVVRSLAMVRLSIEDEKVLIFHNEGFQHPTPFKC